LAILLNGALTELLPFRDQATVLGLDGFAGLPVFGRLQALFELLAFESHEQGVAACDGVVLTPGNGHEQRQACRPEGERRQMIGVHRAVLSLGVGDILRGGTGMGVVSVAFAAELASAMGACHEVREESWGSRTAR
jgi:hypothetical protein